jgi:nitroreductase
MIPLNHTRVAPADAIRAASAFADRMSARRSVREFSPAPIPHGVIEAAIRAAASAPSGANVQPWRFVVVTSPIRKRRLRLAAEAEEREFYTRRASEEWLSALAPIGTDWSKPFLEIAPAVIVVFEVHQGPNSPRP